MRCNTPNIRTPFVGSVRIHPMNKRKMSVCPSHKWPPVQKQTYQEYQRCSFDHFFPECCIPACFQSWHYKGQCISYGKKKKRKYKISRSKSMPGRMFKWWIDMCPGAGIVYQYHQANCSTAKYIKGIEALIHLQRG